MYWKARFERPKTHESLEQELLLLHDKNPNYGYRRMVQALRREGFFINHKKVQRLMKKLGICVSSYWHKSRKYNSYKGTVGRIAKNKLHRRFWTNIPHQKITTDTTEFKHYEDGVQRKLYLNPFLDLFNNEIIAYNISKAPTYKSISNALEQAVQITSDCQYRRTFHSDQGWGYQMKQYSTFLKKNNIFQSMSRKGNCYDNAVMENFFGLLKQEIYYGHVLLSFQALQTAIKDFIYYYNYERIKEKLGWKSPVQFRLEY